mgnify:CR=1 FL=1
MHRSKTCEIDASSSAKVVAQIDADRLEADASSASSILLQGAVQKAVFEASSAASIDARKLVAHFCEAEASSAADIRVYCEQACNPERRAPEAFPMPDRAV